jgi:DNA polymerase I-like protein with 3'-5' exonuclease and polymerase domains
VQGSLAEFNKIWLHQTEHWLHELDAPEALVLNVHDSVVLELPDNTKGEAIAHEIAKRGGELATHIFKIDMHIDISPWYEEQNK